MKSKLNNENIGKIRKKCRLNSEMIWKNRAERQVE
jgi:hypothetical protein